MHYQRNAKYGDPNTVFTDRGNGRYLAGGYWRMPSNGEHKTEHRILAEKALGKPLPLGAEVHHTGEKWDNHGPFKLVICPNHEYHMLLHKRTNALNRRKA